MSEFDNNYGDYSSGDNYGDFGGAPEPEAAVQDTVTDSPAPADGVNSGFVDAVLAAAKTHLTEDNSPTKEEKRPVNLKASHFEKVKIAELKNRKSRVTGSLIIQSALESAVQAGVPNLADSKSGKSKASTREDKIVVSAPRWWWRALNILAESQGVTQADIVEYALSKHMPSL